MEVGVTAARLIRPYRLSALPALRRSACEDLSARFTEILAAHSDQEEQLWHEAACLGTPLVDVCEADETRRNADRISYLHAMRDQLGFG